MRVLLIDGLNLIRRVYAAVPGEPGTFEHNEGALSSIRRSVGRAIEETAATHGLCVMDSAGPGWRHSLYPDYKAARPAMPDTLSALLPGVAEALSELGMPSVVVAGFEADDVLASVVHKAVGRPGLHPIVLSTDKSMLSLLPHGATVRHHFDHRDLTSAYVREHYGVTPAQLLDWIALVGDTSQGVPGAKGIGRKRASALLVRYQNIDTILGAEADDDRENARALAAVQRDADTVRLSRSLVSLRTDANVGVNLQACRIKSMQ